ncbi:hypothetical protein Slala03_01130 [Streptomyces lavendulae subsp. lavendulae]|nr:hypothetical protein Slala03_01130 [Streptomyces lavendulae subsp. lavendulae]
MAAADPAACDRQPVVHGVDPDLLDRALVGWERFLDSFEEAFRWLRSTGTCRTGSWAAGSVTSRPAPRAS